MSEVSQASTTVSVLAFSSASLDHQLRGLLGWLSLQVGLLRLDSVGLRRTQDGHRLYLAFPAPTDRHGKRHEVVRPRDAAARRAIERQVLSALNLDGGGDR